MPTLNHTNVRAQEASEAEVVGTMNNGIGNTTHGEAGYLTGAEMPIPVEGRIVSEAIVLNTSTTQYTALDAVGDLFEIPNMAGYAGGGGTIESVTLMEDTTQAITGTLFLYRTKPAGIGDNANFAPTDADQRRQACQPIAIVSYSSSPNANRTAGASGLGRAYQCAPNSTSLWGQFMTDGTPTYAASGVQLLITARWA